MKYIAIIQGYGEGCRYIIGCNLNYEIFEAENFEDAKKQIKLLIEEEYDDGPATKPIDWRVEYIDFYELGKGHGSVRIHKVP